MTDGSVAWDTGDPIPGTPFRHLVRAGNTEGRFSTQSAVLRAGQLVVPHAHLNEDEFSFVFRGRIGGRVGDHDVVVDEGVIEFISPAGFEGFFEEMGALQSGAAPDTVRELATRDGQTSHPKLIGELSKPYNVAP